MMYSGAWHTTEPWAQRIPTSASLGAASGAGSHGGAELTSVALLLVPDEGAGAGAGAGQRQFPRAVSIALCFGGGGSNWPPGILADPPTHPHQKIFPQGKNEIYQRGPNLEVDFRYTNFFLASDPPPPRYSINQPLSKSLVRTQPKTLVL